MAQNPDRVDELFAQGEEFIGAEQYTDALSSFQAAWDALLVPKEDQELAVQILAAIADCHFYLGAWKQCCDAVQHAFRCGADVGNSFFRMRLGQSLYELGNEREAANWLVPVYLMEGREPFSAYDPKYLESFRNQLKTAPGGWPDGW
jgi:hypothetical protein